MVNVTPDVIFSGSDVFQTTSVNIPIPSGITAGMLMFVAVNFADHQTTTSSVSITGHTSSTAWTLFTPSWTDQNKYLFYKVADSGDAADSAAGGLSWTCNCQDGFIECWAGACWSGVDNTTPFATGPGIAHAISTTFTFASQTAPNTGAVWVGLFLSEGNSGAVTDPSSPVVNQVTGSSGFYDGKAIVYSATGLTGGFSPSGSIAVGNEWAAVAFFLNPASGGGTPIFMPNRRIIYRRR